MDELNLAARPDIVQQDIKAHAMSEVDVDAMAKLAGGYAPLFSKVARKYRGMGLHEQMLTEAEYRKLILEEYTFLKRPVLVVDDQIFIGNSKKNVAAASAYLAAN